jgi:molecular chaperone GrpE (heat shock protein)
MSLADDILSVPAPQAPIQGEQSGEGLPEGEPQVRTAEELLQEQKDILNKRTHAVASHEVRQREATVKKDTQIEEMRAQIQEMEDRYNKSQADEAEFKKAARDNPAAVLERYELTLDSVVDQGLSGDDYRREDSPAEKRIAILEARIESEKLAGIEERKKERESFEKQTKDAEDERHATAINQMKTQIETLVSGGNYPCLELSGMASEVFTLIEETYHNSGGKTHLSNEEAAKMCEDFLAARYQKAGFSRAGSPVGAGSPGESLKPGGDFRTAVATLSSSQNGPSTPAQPRFISHQERLANAANALQFTDN